MSGEWTPPERVDLDICRLDCSSPRDCAEECDRVRVPYVPESKLDEAQEAFSRAVDGALAKVPERAAERDAARVQVEELRARVEELEAGLRTLRDDAERAEREVADGVIRAAVERGPEYAVGVRHMAGNYFEAVAEAIDALLSGSREEPRPDTGETCPECEGGWVDVETTIPYGHSEAVLCPACGGSGYRPDTTKEDRER